MFSSLTPGIIMIRWAETLQCIGNTPLLPIPAITGHPANPVVAYRQLLHVSPTLTANKPLLNLANNGPLQTVTIPTLAKGLCLMLHALSMDTGLYSLHSLCRGGVMAAYRTRANQLDIKCHGTSSSDAFWVYIIAPLNLSQGIWPLSPQHVIVCLFTFVAFCTCHPYMSFPISFYFLTFALLNFIPCTLSSNTPCHTYMVMWALRRAPPVSHGHGLSTSGVKARHEPGANVNDSERVTCYATLYIV